MYFCHSLQVTSGMFAIQIHHIVDCILRAALKINIITVINMTIMSEYCSLYDNLQINIKGVMSHLNLVS